MHKYISLIFIALSILTIALLNVYLIPDFREQNGWHELFITSGVTILTVSVLVLLISFGFSSFRAHVVFLLIAIASMAGVLGGAIIALFVYIAWGAIFAMEVLRYNSGAKNAEEWFLHRYKFKNFQIEYYIFYPIFWLAYFFLEILPSVASKKPAISFSPSRILKKMRKLLSHN